MADITRDSGWVIFSELFLCVCLSQSGLSAWPVHLQGIHTGLQEQTHRPGISLLALLPDEILRLLSFIHQEASSQEAWEPSRRQGILQFRRRSAASLPSWLSVSQTWLAEVSNLIGLCISHRSAARCSRLWQQKKP